RPARRSSAPAIGRSFTAFAATARRSRASSWARSGCGFVESWRSRSNSPSEETSIEFAEALLGDSAVHVHLIMRDPADFEPLFTNAEDQEVARILHSRLGNSLSTMKEMIDPASRKKVGPLLAAKPIWSDR